MSDPVISVVNLGKSYRIAHLGARSPYRTLREDVLGAFSRRRRASSEQFWALEGVHFDVGEGEVVGIVGRNGAGKSTLLKILSRITDPSTGYADVSGRVGSLLEVGTGFHPELSGRENIFLNGAILGMKRPEIARKFDEIVAFAEVEKFLDTPVKRYSSGMYVRLAFAVAAHMDPDILLVDEVLAVGDAAFQQRCLGKLGDVAGGGRTVLFVSHNMAAVSGLCKRVIWLDGGRVREDADVATGISRYMSQLRAGAEGDAGSVSLQRHPGRRKGFDGAVRLTHCRLLDAAGGRSRAFRSGDAMRIVLGYATDGAISAQSVQFSVIVQGAQEQRLACLTSETTSDWTGALAAQGEVACDVPSLPLAPGGFSLSLFCRVSGGWSDAVYGALGFEVVAGPDGAAPPALAANLVTVANRWELAGETAELRA